MKKLVEDLAGTRALRFERPPPATIDRIVIVGSTCAGKTTLAGAVRAAALPGVDIPRRFVTRPPRRDDVVAEASYLTSDELDAAIAAGAISMHWRRTFEAGRSERYAFAVPRTETLAVYSANNAIFVDGNVQPAGALERALLVGVYAPDAIREQRLRARSPALFRDHPDEVAARLGERAESMVSHVHVVIENHGALEPLARDEIVRLVRAVRG
jgi:ribose 1,5-bisphosphokinase PhnN